LDARWTQAAGIVAHRQGAMKLPCHIHTYDSTGQLSIG
jgi:hypothetical protein